LLVGHVRASVVAVSAVVIFALAICEEVITYVMICELSTGPVTRADSSLARDCRK
jgi:hypothetical protein